MNIIRIIQECIQIQNLQHAFFGTAYNVRYIFGVLGIYNKAYRMKRTGLQACIRTV